MKKIIQIVFVAMLFSFSVHTYSKSEIASGSIIEYGIYSKKLKDENHASAISNNQIILDAKNLGRRISRNYVFHQKADTCIGLKYRLKGVPSGNIELEFRVKNMSYFETQEHPQLEFISKVVRKARKGEIKGVVGFSFYENEVMVPGVWNIAIYHKGDLIISSTFEAIAI